LDDPVQRAKTVLPSQQDYTPNSASGVFIYIVGRNEQRDAPLMISGEAYGRFPFPQPLARGRCAQTDTVVELIDVFGKE